MRVLRLSAVVAVVALLSSSCFWIGHASLSTGGTQAANHSVAAVDISADGRYVLLHTRGALDATDTDGRDDLYRRDMLTGTTIRVSVPFANGNLGAHVLENAEMSDDGNRIVFTTAANVLGGANNGELDVYLRDVTAFSTSLISESAAGGNGNGASENPAISADGSVVAFASDADNLIASDVNGQRDVFRHDTSTGTTTLMSAPAAGGSVAGFSDFPSVNGDGSLVAFESVSSQLVSGDTNSSRDVFVKSTSGYIERVSVATGGGQSNGNSQEASINAIGDRISFSTFADNLVTGDTDFARDVIIRDIGLGTTVNASATIDTTTLGPSIDASGNTVAYENGALGTYAYDALTGVTTAVSVDLLGTPVAGNSAAISSDGRYVAYDTAAALAGTDTNALRDVFVIAWREPAPTSVNPSSASRGSTIPVTINGSRFETGAKVYDVSGVLSFTNVVVQSTTQITAEVTVPAGAPLGLRWVNVQNPDGGPGVDSGSLNSCNCLTVTN